MRVSFFFIVLFYTLFPAIADGQVTIVVDKIPEFTPPQDSIYIAGDFNDWTPGDARYRMKKQNDGSYFITLSEEQTVFRYKITRGTWQTVEGDINGEKLEDRVVNLSPGDPSILSIEVLSWEDMSQQKSWNIILRNIPENTPFDALIFISGSFNGWKEDDHRYRLSKLPDGTYAVKIPKERSDSISYKFHRGDWRSVECRGNGRTQLNRISTWDQSKSATTLLCEVAAWEDLSGGSNEFFSFILIAAAMQILVAAGALASIKEKNKEITATVIGLLFLTSVTILARLASYSRSVFDWEPKLLLLADISYFLYAPVFYLLINKIMGSTARLRPLYLILISALVVQGLFYLRPLIMPRQDFVLANIDGEFTIPFHAAAVAASLYNLVFTWLAARALMKKKSDFAYTCPSARLYATTLVVSAWVVVTVWLLSHFLYASKIFLGFDTTIIHEYMVDAAWIVFALTPYIHVFFAVRNTELFRQKLEEEKKVGFHQKVNLASLKASLETLMEQRQPYRNPKLNLQDLADMMRTNIHTVSWLINEGYQKNFFDFINHYRVEDFKRLVASERHKNYTFLAIAMEAGFSSKTTFNRAFKKAAGKTPREYFNLEDAEMAETTDA